MKGFRYCRYRKPQPLLQTRSDGSGTELRSFSNVERAGIRLADHGTEAHADTVAVILLIDEAGTAADRVVRATGRVVGRDAAIVVARECLESQLGV